MGNMHLFAIELYITNNIFLLLLVFIYYTSVFPLDKKSFGEFSNAQTEKPSQSHKPKADQYGLDLTFTRR